MSAPVAPAPAGRPEVPTSLPRHRSLAIEPPQRGILAVLALGAFMTSLDSSIVGLSLPAIARAFNTPVGGRVEWVSIAYLVSVAALLLSVGRLSDMVSRAPLWISGLVIFTIGSVLCGMAPSLDLLIAARGLQGIGGALIVATGVAILGETFLAGERGIAFGIVGMASAISSCIGPVLGGVINDHLDWRTIFFINVPISLAAIIAGLRILPRGHFGRRPKFDIVGAILLGLGVAGVTIALWFGSVWGWISLRFAAATALVIILLVGAVLVDRRATAPLIDLSIFRGQVFTPALSRLMLSRFALMAPSFLLPFYLLQLRDFPGQTAGLLMTPFPIAVMILSPVSGVLVDRFRPHWLELAGLAAIAMSLVLLARLDAVSSLVEIVCLLALVGIGQGLFSAPNSKAILDAAPDSEEGEASGLLSTGRVVGQSVSIAITSAIFAGLGGGAASALLSHSGASLDPQQLAETRAIFLGGFQVALFASAAFAVLGALTILIQVIRPSDSTAPSRSTSSRQAFPRLKHGPGSSGWRLS